MTEKELLINGVRFVRAEEAIITGIPHYDCDPDTHSWFVRNVRYSGEAIAALGYQVGGKYNGRVIEQVNATPNGYGAFRVDVKLEAKSKTPGERVAGKHFSRAATAEMLARDIDFEISYEREAIAQIVEAHGFMYAISETCGPLAAQIRARK